MTDLEALTHEVLVTSIANSGQWNELGRLRKLHRYRTARTEKALLQALGDEASNELGITLEMPSSSWCVGDEVELLVLLENWTAKDMIIGLGDHSTGTSSGAALAAAGLQCVVADAQGEIYWTRALALQPRGCPLRQRAVFLPPWQAVRLTMACEVVSAGSISGLALRFGAQRSDAAEILLPLGRMALGEAAAPIPRSINFSLQGFGDELRTNLGPIIWVGPHEPREVSFGTCVFQGLAESKQIEVIIFPDARGQTSAVTPSDRVWQKKLRNDAGIGGRWPAEAPPVTPSLKTKPKKVASRPPSSREKSCKGRRAQKPPGSMAAAIMASRREAGELVSRATEAAVDRIARPRASPSGSSAASSRPHTRDVAKNSPPSSAAAASDLDPDCRTTSGLSKTGGDDADYHIVEPELQGYGMAAGQSQG